MDETREDEGMELTDEQLEDIAGGGKPIELPEVGGGSSTNGK